MAFILASASPRRFDLLKQIGRTPDSVIPADVDEAALPSEQPGALAVRLAALKAEAVAADHANDVVLGADTVVACGRRVLPKPDTEDEAKRFLSLLSGRRHRVFGGIAVIAPTGKWTRSVVTQVVFKRLTDTDIAAYLASGEWDGKAGAYGIQGRAGTFVKRVNGSYTNVVGLCVHTVEPLLQSCLGPVSHADD